LFLKDRKENGGDLGNVDGRPKERCGLDKGVSGQTETNPLFWGGCKEKQRKRTGANHVYQFKGTGEKGNRGGDKATLGIGKELQKDSPGSGPKNKHLLDCKIGMEKGVLGDPRMEDTAEARSKRVPRAPCAFMEKGSVLGG